MAQNENVLTLQKRLQGGFVLVVEDSPINQQIAEEFIQALAVDYCIVENGQEAIESLKKRPADVVLMDLQMPIMNGFEATDVMRQSSEFAHIPVIAMTADNDETQKSVCLSNGFTDYVVKSLNAEPLYEAMLRHVKEAGHAQQTASSNFEYVKALKTVRNNAVLLDKLLADFYHQHQHDMDIIKAAIQGKDDATAKRIMHTLVGISGSIGAQQLYAEASTLNNAWQTNDLRCNIEQLTHVDAAFNDVMHELKEQAAHQKQLQETTAPSAFDKQAVGQLINTLATQVAQYCPDASQTAESLNNICQEKPELAEISIQLFNQLTVFSFDDAKQSLHRFSDIYLALP